MRSQGQVRFIKVSSRVQMTGAACVAALALGWAGSMGVMAWSQYQSEAELASFEQDKAKVASAQERIDAYGNDLERVIEELDGRQEFLDAMLPMLPEEIREAGVNVTDSTKETEETVDKVGALIPQARGLAEVEARQLAFVERITRYADYRAKKAEDALRQLNLDPKMLARSFDDGSIGGMGGPLEILATSANGSLDPRFERLGLSLARMSQLEQVLEGVPQIVPTPDGRVTSPFGFRRDPITGRAAMHNGIDYGGPVGSPIFAAAAGKVTFVGWKSGYGKTVEVVHGNGMMTRYAHLSRFDVIVGEQVAAGATIAGLGNTGRSTGPHLHFEVRINDRAVNPRKFLEIAPNVLKEIRGAGKPRTTTPATTAE